MALPGESFQYSDISDLEVNEKSVWISSGYAMQIEDKSLQNKDARSSNKLSLFSKSMKSTQSSARFLLGNRHAPYRKKTLKDVNKGIIPEDEESIEKPINIDQICVNFKDQYGVKTKRQDESI